MDVGSAADPVAAVLEAHATGRRITLRTSGSTGRPRSVVRTTESWVRSFASVAALTELSAGSRLWLPGPLSATMNLFAATLARHLGVVQVERPRDATHAHLTPLALGRLLDETPVLDGVRVTVAGDRLDPALHDRAVAAGALVSHYYGASELSFVAWGAHADDLTAFPGVEAEARDGVLWVRSPYLCEGYDGPPGALRVDEHGFATVGDRGSVVDGRITVAGRGSEGVTTGGATVHVADVEEALRAAVRGEVAVLGVPHGTLGEVVAAVLTDPADFAAARRVAGEALAPVQRPRLWFAAEALPTTEAGKLDRGRLRSVVGDPATLRLTVAGVDAPAGTR